ncbi:MAG: hypothetical protein HGJ94_02015 [Desulfosarcina sp.]|nr:hypothetical protein [Desulfosarcina sp.]MBC2743450.1 hypothetical protein [Desulfosarcina sp.]MBC2766360.1 hypothetical protein [Desulfosarcina sp.]
MSSNLKSTTGKRKFVLSFVVLMMIILASTGALAQQAASETGSWQFGVGIYGWFPDIAGQTAFTPPGGSSEFEIDIDNILDNLEFTLMGTFDMRKGRWGLLTDVIYMDVGGSETGTREASIGGNQIPINAAADVNLDIESWIWTLVGYYRAIEQTGMTLDVLGGMRYLDVEQSVNWNITGNVGEIPVPDRTGAAKASLSNWDLIFGARGRFAFGAQHAWFVPYYFDLGAGDSDFTWQGVAGLGYAFHWGEVTAVWRYLYYDLSSDKPIKDMDFSGPAVGYTFRW